MSIIKTHDITLYYRTNINIFLRPLCDDHLQYLYKWCADPKVPYWTEGGTAETDLSYGADTVNQIYGEVSQDALCFLVEVDGVPIGECWVQKMNLPEVKAMYSEDPVQKCPVLAVLPPGVRYQAHLLWLLSYPS